MLFKKYTLGSEICNQSRAVLGLIVQANGARDWAPVLLELRQHLDELLILLRLAKEVQAFRSFRSLGAPSVRAASAAIPH